MTDPVELEPTQFDLSAMSRSELEAEIVHQAKLIERISTSLGHIAMNIEDEGDRAYFGSTNDADTLREIDSDMSATLFELEMPWMHGRDLYADLRDKRAKVEKLREAIIQGRDDLLAVGNDYPGSSCQKWCADAATRLWGALEPWKNCPSTHCERSEECRSVNECSANRTTLAETEASHEQAR